MITKILSQSDKRTVGFLKEMHGLSMYPAAWIFSNKLISLESNGVSYPRTEMTLYKWP